MASTEAYTIDASTSDIPEIESNAYSLEYRVITTILFVCCMAFLIFANGLVILSYALKKVPRTLSYYYLSMLAGVDMSIGFAMPFNIVSSASVQLSSSTTYCLMETLFTMCAITGSSFTMLSLTIDRYMALSSPLLYVAEMTQRRYIERTLLVWFVPITVFFILPLCWHNELDETPVKTCFTLYILKREYTAYITLPIAFCNVIGVAFTYIPIISIALRQSRSIHASQPERDSEQSRKMRSHVKMVKTTSMVLVPYYAAWIPWCIFASGVVYSQDSYANPGLFFTAAQYATFGVLVNSGINPFVFAARMPVYKAAFKSLLRCKTGIEPATCT
ncbi:hypothetical protein CAPTEDRAFT_200653 [Capitella teleta]|uniref:G-protein coupled receptors family 1 profile domain-containing protein n=1 Tax=Capitella teleta TaxID=283909 RepID=R7U2B6_CAPTE|nr:hypothetical protein CAPTEDRAFT_200653 [Capitella teleta]|eukprot:ELU00150.1 hypothetical protein CAPTEDRAFT_200653 [Capitella teleta]